MSKSNLVSALENESETLQNITDYFVPIMRNFNIFFFWEQEPTSLGRLGRTYVVSHESAAPTYDETERAAIAADHRGMVRFDNPQSQGFRMVADALLRYCDEAPNVIRQRCRDAAKSLGLARSREAAETLGRNFHPREAAPHAPMRVESGLDGFSITGTSRSETFHSICNASDCKT